MTPSSAAKVFDSIPFLAVSLYTREGRYVATVETLPWANGDAWPDVILWRNRAFVRDDEGVYREGFAWCAVMPQIPDYKVQTTRDLP